MAMTDEQAEAGRVGFGKVVAKAWNDSAFKTRLLNDPHAALAEAGVPVASGVTVKVIEDTAAVQHLVLPAAPAEGELTDEALDKVAGGGRCICLTCKGPR